MPHYAISLLTALTLVFASATAAASNHRCNGKNMPSADCCCDHDSDADEAEPQQGAEIQGSCCQFQAPTDGTRPSAPAALDSQTPQVLAPAITAPALITKLPRTITVAPRGSPPSVRGPPAYLRNCRFLI